MKRRLFLKFVIGYIVYGIIAYIFIITFVQKYTYNTTIGAEAQNLYREANHISSDYATEYYRASITLSDFQKHMEIVGDYLSSEIWIIDAQGNILIKSSDPDISADATNQEYITIENFDATNFGNSYYVVGDFYSQFNNDTLTVFSPITINYKNRGYVLIHKSAAAITRNTNLYSNITFYASLILFVLGFLLYIMYNFTIFKPVKKITKVANQYAKGDFSHKIDVHSNDEIGYLANTLNYMAQELDRLEEDQRKFVSNVSHDFRSPLTSIKGYINAMLDGTIPVEMQEKYMNIILSETERLNKLTQSLIDLNQFGHHGIRLDIADFDINNMIRTSILTFEGKCYEKNISFDLVLTGKELFVTGDMTKIQQILYNLIDNATKFSHHNSSIKIETNIKNEKVFISVKDTGIGIPADSLNKIWERFYKTDSSRGKDKKGTGLGLAIVKEIVQAHNEHINVISTEGVGTEFIFTLPLARREE